MNPGPWLSLALLAGCSPAPADRPSAAVPIPRSDVAWWLRHHNEYVERARRGQVDLLFLGDSITQGWLGDGRDAAAGDGLAIWNDRYAPRRAANFGLGSDRTEHLLWRIDHGELAGIAPRLVVLLIGTNNLDNGDPPAEVAAGVAAILDRLRVRLPNSRVLLLGLLPRGHDPGPWRAKVAETNRLLSRFADGRRVVFLDIGPRFLDDRGRLPPSHSPDGLHLTRLGYATWADAMEPTLAGLLAEPREPVIALPIDSSKANGH